MLNGRAFDRKSINVAGPVTVVVAAPPVQFENELANFQLAPGVRFSISGERVDEVAEFDKAEVAEAQRNGPVWAIQRHLRQRIVLHATAYVVDGKAFCIAAPSGTGKSTIGAALRKAGAGFLSDDLASIGPNLDVESGPPHVRMWPDTVSWSGEDSGQFRRMHPDFDKQVAPLTPVASRAPLGAIFFLSRGDNLEVNRQSPTQGILDLTAHTYVYQMYRPRCPDWPADPWHFALAANIVNTVPLYNLQVQDDMAGLGAAADLVLQTVKV